MVAGHAGHGKVVCCRWGSPGGYLGTATRCRVHNYITGTATEGWSLLQVGKKLDGEQVWVNVGHRAASADRFTWPDEGRKESVPDHACSPVTPDHHAIIAHRCLRPSKTRWDPQVSLEARRGQVTSAIYHESWICLALSNLALDRMKADTDWYVHFWS